MRVLHICSGNLYGGVEALLVTLARERHICPEMEPHFALCFEGRLSAELAASGVPVHLLGNVRSTRPLTVQRSRIRLCELFRDGSFDRTICHSAWSQAIFGPAVRRAGSPLVVWRHDATNGPYWLKHWARRSAPDLAICNSKFTISTLCNTYRGVSRKLLYYPVTLLQPTYSSTYRTGLRAALNTSADATVIVQVSRMEPWKGQSLHLEALGMLASLPGWVCWLVGGPQRPHEFRYLKSLQRTADRLGIGHRVRFIGQRSDIPKLLGAADIFCQPNTGAEPFGIVFIEALSAGLPVVTTTLGAAAEIIDTSCGILVPPADPGALASKLRHLIQDSALRKHLGRNGPARALTLCQPSRQIASLNEILASMGKVQN